MFCNHCGQKLADDAKFCMNCGARVVVPEPVPVFTPAAEPIPVPVAEPIPAAAPAPKKKKKAPVALFIIIPLVLILAGVGIWFVMERQEQAELKAAYEEAVELLEAKKYDKALKAFKKLEDFEDSEEHVERLETLQEDYDTAMELLEDREYDDALEAFEALGNYRDSEEQEETLLQLQANYDHALHLLEQREYDEVIAILETLGDYRDAEEQILILEDQQNQYEKAVVLLEDGWYDDAIAVFTKLGDYRDSAEMAEFGVPYARAMDAYGWATDLDDFLEAGQMFDQLDGYEDADSMASTCYLKVCQLYLERGDMTSAMSYSEYLNETDGAAFQTMLNESVADAKALADLEKALQTRYDLSSDANITHDQLVAAELEYMMAYENATFMDAGLGELVAAYLQALRVQEASLNGSTYPYDMVMWMEGALQRCNAITELYHRYGFLSNNSVLSAQHVDKQAYFQACIAIETALEDQLWYITPSQNDGGYYLSFTNDTGYTFYVTFLQRYGLGEYFVGPEHTPAGTIETDATEKIPLEFNDDLEYDSWYLDWSFYDIYDGETKLD